MSTERNFPQQTSIDQLPEIVNGLRGYFMTGATRPLEWRKSQLRGLAKCLREHEADWVRAMFEDMGSHSYEASLLIANVLSEVEHTLSNIGKWMKAYKISNPWALWPGGTEVVPEPYGVVCDFVPYNYPMYLGFSTLTPILAAGNCCLFKPSSNTPACAKLYQDLLREYLDPNAISVVCGPSSICPSILENRFDFIFYTGSPAIAKGVMQAASRYLTPVLLELGGKSPVYIDNNVSMLTACRRLLWGKVFNGGQTCVCPDYVLVHEAVMNDFKETMVKVIQEFYGDVTVYNDNVTHIINRRHFDRICRSIETSGGSIIVEGLRDPERLYIGPTLIENPRLDSQMMTEEIFGPVLPYIPVRDAEAAIDFINQREKPLALYVFTSNSRITEQFAMRTSSGALMENDVVFHVSSADCPFGGVGNSGMGQYHGLKGFMSLSHPKPVVSHSTFMDMTIRYPPYTDGHLNLMKKFC